MASLNSPPTALHEMGQAAWRWLGGWWRIILLGAEILVLLLSPSSYRRASRARLMQHIYQATAPNLLWFTVLTSLFSLVLIRIVVVTALSYGLSQYALEMVVRVLVLELIPLTAALFVAMRYSLPRGAELHSERDEPQRPPALALAAHELLPTVVAGMLAVLTLAAVSCLVSLVLAYVTVYGFTTAAFMSYTRTVGHIFSPTVTLIFGLKTLFFSLAVSLIPCGTSLQLSSRELTRASVALQGLVRMFVVLLLVEVASLVGNYY